MQVQTLDFFVDTVCARIKVVQIDFEQTALSRIREGQPGAEIAVGTAAGLARAANIVREVLAETESAERAERAERRR